MPFSLKIGKPGGATKKGGGAMALPAPPLTRPLQLDNAAAALIAWAQPKTQNMSRNQSRLMYLVCIDLNFENII